MASTVAIAVKMAAGNQFERRGTFNVGVYATSGVTITAGQLALSSILSFHCGSYGGVLYEATINAAKTAVTIKAYWDNAVAAAAALGEVTNATDLSAHAPSFGAYGH